MKVLVTGGAGYIGAHTLVELLSQGHDAVVVDDFSGGSRIALARVRELTGRDIAVEEADIRDAPALRDILCRHRPDAVIHFAGLKAVGESGAQAGLYWRVNVGGTLALLGAMEAAGCGRILLSSSATVYGTPLYLPYDESHPLAPQNVYGRTKAVCEQALADWAQATGPDDTAPAGGAARGAIALRYFNPVGAHASGRIGEAPRGVPANLVPFLAQVADGSRPALRVWGEDYDTPDGTGIRDYIHVVDLARAHLAALDRLMETPGFEVFNIGTGQGRSVREIHAAFERATGRTLPLEIGPRRPGDIARMEADPSLARTRLGWEATLGLDDMIASHWHWQRSNPGGYGDNREPDGDD